jgi:hypothetical protein
MWKAAVILAAGFFTIGCACNAPEQQAKVETEATPVLAVYRQAPSSALAFDPPVAMDEPRLNLDRDIRNPEAFVAYESGTATFYYVRTDDRDFTFSGNDFGHFERRAITTRVGVSYR